MLQQAQTNADNLLAAIVHQLAKGSLIHSQSTRVDISL